MKTFTSGLAIVLILCTTACASSNGKPGVGDQHAFKSSPMDPSRRISEQDCRYAFNFDGGNLRCL